MEKPTDLDMETTDVFRENFFNSMNTTSASFEDGSSGFGKFKDAQTLLEAYNNLQAEFTRKCQKIAELNKLQKTQNVNSEIGNVAKTSENSDRIPNLVQEDAGQRIDTPSQNVVSENASKLNTKDFDKQVKEFFFSNPDAKVYAKQMSNILLENPELAKGKDAVALAFRIAKSESFKSPKELASDENFLSDYIYNSKEIANKILSSVLDKAKQNIAPKIISGEYGSSSFYKNKTIDSLEDAKDFVMIRLKEK